ncbi:DUF317 domain-containing protein [Streptomyces sp. NPDC056178]|uniref:DUF317 domain-containing protein n=1 Tax=unclassified Streptomyces TaxID=2593676 RepID=UPI0035DC871C
MKKRQQQAGQGNVYEQPQQHYLVEPRHLAGGGDLRHVTEYLRASGWKDQSKTGGPAIFDSPDQSVRIGYDPFTAPGGWTVSGRPTSQQPAWQATLTRQTPVEIVAGLTDALAKPRTAHAPNPWAPLVQQGWKSSSGRHFTVTNPQNTARLQYHQSGPGEAIWWASARSEHGRAWDATFTSTTPMHLIEAFSVALADPRQVMRPRGHIPPSQHIRTTSVSVRPSELGAWQQTRINAARTATWARNTWASARPRKNPHGASPYASAGTHTRR